jgi:hypothetical protein
MIRKSLQSVSLSLTLLGLLFIFNQTAFAGPPLLCHPFETGQAKSLPWGGDGWKSTKADYDLKRLADDTLALLTPATPILARMETLRRATVYAMKDERVAADLHARLLARAHKAGDDALALFDIGLLKEIYRHANLIQKMGISSDELNGYDSVVKAISLRRGDAEMEFAAALIAQYPRRGSYEDHLRKAISGAAEGSLLARNLVSHFRDRGASLAELRTSLGVAKN